MTRNKNDYIYNICILFQEYTVEILNFPLFFIPITPSLFVTPPFKNLFPFFKEDLQTGVYDIKKVSVYLYKYLLLGAFDTVR